MPEVSRFFGIIIRLFTETGKQHHMPHIHVYFQDKQAVYSIETAELLVGELPRREQRLVEAWIELHKEELMNNWKRASEGKPIDKISPLR